MDKKENNIKEFKKSVLITGGCGFIGSHLVRKFVTKYPDYFIVNLDLLTYAGNPDNLVDIITAPNYADVKGDINDRKLMIDLFRQYDFDIVMHMAAESHVDRSLVNATVFAETNVLGTLNLLQVAKECWTSYKDKVFFNMITDEIFGSLSNDDPPFNEKTKIDPHSPYSTSKAAQYMFGKTYWESYGLPVISLCCGNAIGPNQYPEKLVPLTIDRLIHKQPIPVYGKGEQKRDWTSVFDICVAIDMLVHSNKIGELYCIGGDSCISNIEMIHRIIDEYCSLTGENKHDCLNLITFIEDPRGKSHDFRYDLNHNKITNDLGWMPLRTLDKSVSNTVSWYLGHQNWCDNIKDKSENYNTWIKTYYKQTKNLENQK